MKTTDNVKQVIDNVFIKLHTMLIKLLKCDFLQGLFAKLFLIYSLF